MMNSTMQRKLLWQILPGFIPLFVFIIADEVWGTKIGLVVAIALGLVSLFWFWIKDKKFDRFIFFDTILIVILGLISILLDNDVFFKLKPALIGVLMCIVLGVSAFSPSNILLNMSKRYMKGIELTSQHYIQMRKSMKSMFFLFSFYTALVFYSVWFMSNEAWAFISGGLFYILFGVYFLFEYISNKLKLRKIQNEEWLPIVNNDGQVIGKAPRSQCHMNKELLHPVVHMHVLNSKGDIFLQKRPMHKKIQPGKWDTAVGGHIAFGESVELSLQRESEEEIGIKDFKPQLVSKYVWRSEVESEYIFCFITIYDGPFSLAKDELDGGHFWTVDEIKRNLDKSVFTPNFEKEYREIISKIKIKK